MVDQETGTKFNSTFVWANTSLIIIILIIKYPNWFPGRMPFRYTKELSRNAYKYDHQMAVTVNADETGHAETASQ